MNQWIYTENIGNGVFSIARIENRDYKFVFIDKHGIANIFNTMADYTAYVEGDLSCERECVTIEPTDIEGYDSLDAYLGMEEF